MSSNKPATRGDIVKAVDAKGADKNKNKVNKEDPVAKKPTESAVVKAPAVVKTPAVVEAQEKLTETVQNLQMDEHRFEDINASDQAPSLSKSELTSLAGSQYRFTVNAGSEIPVNFPMNALFAERAPVLQIFRLAMMQARIANIDSGSKAPAYIAECGVYRGRCTRAMFEIAESVGVDIEITGLDTFGGLPSLSENDLKYAPERAKYRRQRVFADTTEKEVQAYVGPSYAKKLKLLKGEFKNTLKKIPKDKKFSFVFVDCDLYEGHINALEFFYNRMQPGGIIFLDDYFSKEYPMAKAAVDSFLEDKPEELFDIRYGPYPWSIRKAFIVRN